jgi:cell division septation protein DedD
MAKIKNRNSDSHKTKPKGTDRKAFERVYWPYIPIVVAITLLLGLGNAGGALKAAVHHPLGNVLSYSTSMSTGGLLSDTNVQRNANGVGSLSLNGQLNSAAQAKADDMAARNYWSHNTPEGNPPWVFVDAQGYSYQKLGENLATGFADEQSTINGWMASPPHRENLLDSAFSEVGFGYANNPNYTAAGGGPMTIVVAMYGEPAAIAAPAPAAPAPPAATNSVHSATTSAAAVPTETPAAETPAAADDNAKPAKQPATTDTNTKDLTASVKTSHLQLAAPTNSFGSLVTKLSLVLALVIVLLWANRHIRALHKFFVKGERYALRHPLTDIGVLTIAALLFILSHTAGLIQ